MKRIIILGITGSIGSNAVDVIRGLPDSFDVVGISAHQNERKLLRIGKEFPKAKLALSGASSLSNEIDYYGSGGLLTMIEELNADIVINGIAGSKGLLPSISALQHSRLLALANKETVVMGGNLIIELAKTCSTPIIPVDSEHSALFSLLNSVGSAGVEEYILTASGGAFRDTPLSALKTVSLQDALRHPTWEMGRKITIDSATLANKGLEVIECHYLFSAPPDDINVLVHPQSLVHSIIRTFDGCLYAQISEPDMKLFIQNALTYPYIRSHGFKKLDLAGKSLTFTTVDEKKFPMLPLAYRSIKEGEGMPIVYNAANEIAVHAFLDQKIRYIDIGRIVESTMDELWEKNVRSFDEVLHMDERARKRAEFYIQRLQKE